MQKALAVSPFPLAVAEVTSAAPDPHGDGFAASFNEALLVTDEESRMREVNPTGLIEMSAWMGTFPPAAHPLALVADHSTETRSTMGLEVGTVEVPSQNGPMGSDASGVQPEAETPDAQPSLTGVSAQAGTPESVLTENSLPDTSFRSFRDPKTVDLSSETPIQEGKPASADDTGVMITDPEQVSHGSASIVSALPAPSRLYPDLAAATEMAMSGPGDQAGEPTTAPAQAGSTSAVATGDLAPVGAQDVHEPAGGLDHPESTPQTKVEAVFHAEQPLSAGLTHDPAVASDSAEADKPLPVVHHGSDTAIVSVLQEPTKAPEKPSQSASSFWESFFADAASPEASGKATGNQTGDLTGHSVETLPVGEAATASGATMPAAIASTDVFSQTAQLDARQSRREDRREASLAPRTHESTPTQPSPNVVPATAALAVAPIVLSEWSEGFDPSGEQIEGAGAAFISGSSSLGSANLARAEMLGPAVIPQVAAQLVGVILKSPDNSTILALAPEELGRVQLRLEPDANNPDRMVVMISVERPETLDLFRRHASELAEAIRNAGYSGADIGFGQHGQGGSQNQQNAAGWAGRTLTPDEPGPTPIPSRPAVGASLDLRL